MLGFFDLDQVKQATLYVQSLPDTDKSVVESWLWVEGLLMGLYYILLFAVVFFLGRRIIQAVIAGYREARAEAV